MVKKLDDLVLYQESMELAHQVFDIADKWTYYYQNTLGSQLVRACASIAANISEGYGRFHFNDRLQFCYYARGSLFETRTHLRMAMKRGIVPAERSEELTRKMELIHKLLNAYIKSLVLKKN